MHVSNIYRDGKLSGLPWRFTLTPFVPRPLDVIGCTAGCCHLGSHPPRRHWSEADSGCFSLAFSTLLRLLVTCLDLRSLWSLIQMDRGPLKACMVTAIDDSTDATQSARRPSASVQWLSLPRELSFFLAKTLPARPERCCWCCVFGPGVFACSAFGFCVGF